MRYAEIDRATNIVINVIVLNKVSDYGGTNLVIKSDTAEIGDTWNGGTFIKPPPPPPQPINDIFYFGSSGRRYTISPTEPDSKNPGDYWDEESSSGIIWKWCWSGTNWIGRKIIQRDTLLISGQSISLTNVLVGLVTTQTDDIPIAINPKFGIYFTNFYAALTVPSGNLSATNYWRLVLKNGSKTLQTLNVTAGDDGATSGDIRKSSPEINLIYPKGGKFSLSLLPQGTPIALRSPSGMFECRLVR